MKTNFIFKTIFLLCFYFAMIINAMSQDWVSLNDKGNTETKINLVSSSEKEIIVEFSINSYKLNEVSLSNGKAINPVIPGGTPLLDKGAPNLQKLARSIIIPDKDEMQVEVMSSDYIEINDVDIAPSKGSFNRTIEPESVPYIYNESYEQNSFYPGKLATLGEAYILKDFRGQTIYTYPLQYNPVTKTLRVYKNIKVKITSKGNEGINQITRESQPENIDIDFGQLYERHFLNYEKTRYTPVAETGKMLIISHANYITTMQTLVAWKKLKGIQTEIVDIATIGNTTTAITNYIKNYYTTTSNKTLKFVLLVGDYAQITSPTVAEPGYSSNSGPADISYGYIEGSDHYAEVFVGRFSCETVADAQTQVDRTIHYERDLQTTDTWINKGLVVGSNDVTGTNYNGEYDWSHLRNKVRADMLAATYVSIPEMYEGSQGGLDASGDPTAAMVSASINGGIGCFVYSGHADWNYLVASNFTTTNASALTNVGKLPHIWVLGCNPGQFHNKKCLAECFMRAQSSNAPSGALTAYMSSTSQLWDPPYAHQIEMIDILTGQLSSNYKITAGGLAYNSCMKMIELFPNTTDGGAFTADTWILFGDPSIVVFTNNPTAMTVTHAASIDNGTNQFVVNCDVANALISLTVGGEIIATAYSNGGANTINISPALNTSSSTMQVTVTAQNKVTYLGNVSILTTSINNITVNNQSEIYLNPSANCINIKTDVTNFEGTISDISGRVVKQFKNDKTVDVSSLENGVYLCRLMIDHEFISKKILLMKND